MPNGTPLTPEQQANIVVQSEQRHKQVRDCTKCSTEAGPQCCADIRWRLSAVGIEAWF